MSNTEKKKSRKIFSILALIAVVAIVAILTVFAINKPNYELYEEKEINLPKNTATYVLIPGGGHGAWCYDMVIDQLEEAGQTAYAVSLPGTGERASELTSDIGLEDHIDATVDFITENDLHDVILVGHSYGGMVITGTADRIPDRIKTIVYLDAVHPKNNQNLIEAQPLVEHVPIVSEPSVIDGVEVNLVPGDETLKFLGLTEEEDINFAKDKLTPHPWKTFTDKLTLQNPNIVEDIGKYDIYTKTTIDGLDNM
ncbi:MAG: alpha/beta hydrolase [Lachnospiraceae bacterium]|nr:alpha/beta hydrolase [Lachnospiraceae bacterium]